ncbi:hypothetical protein A8M56_08410 [Yersinia pestis]|nr:hypothetical protein A8M56_08410 [Yersinia pestis]
MIAITEGMGFILRQAVPNDGLLKILFVAIGLRISLGGSDMINVGKPIVIKIISGAVAHAGSQFR